LIETIEDLIAAQKAFPPQEQVRLALRQRTGDLSYSIGDIEFLGDGNSVVYFSTGTNLGDAPRSDDTYDES
jgi:hypothetical protein